MKNFLRRLAPAVVGIVVFALLWEAFVHVLGVRRFVLLPPSTIVQTAADDPGFYLRNALTTGRHMLVGLSIALVLAIGAGAVMAASRFVEEAAQPVLILILVTPWVAYITSVVLWLDGGEPTIVFMVAFTSFPVLTFGVVGGMKSGRPSPMPKSPRTPPNCRALISTFQSLVYRYRSKRAATLRWPTTVISS